MIVGNVTASLEARVCVLVIGPTCSQQVDAIIDTGFKGFLTLPSAWIAALGLPWTRTEPSTVALQEAWEEAVDVYEANMVWENSTRLIEVFELNCPPLLGMKALQNHALRIEIVDGGAVTILPHP